MNNITFANKISPRTKSLIIITVLILLGIIIGYIFSQISLQILINEIENLPIQIDQTRITRSINYYIAAMIFLTVYFSWALSPYRLGKQNLFYACCSQNFL